MPSFEVRWYQKEPELVNSWEFQYAHGADGVWQDVAVVTDATACLDCFKVFIEAPVDATHVRSRAIGPGGISDWSTPVLLSEPDILLALLSGVLFIVFAFGRARWRKWF